MLFSIFAMTVSLKLSRSSAGGAQGRDNHDLIEEGSHGSYKVCFTIDDGRFPKTYLCPSDIGINKAAPFLLYFSVYQHPLIH